MAGRGCTIIVKLLGGSTGDGEVEELCLPVALHSPLQVLKEQLMSIVGIPITAQVLILCDLSDPDRNSDVLLSGREGSTLRACGIRNGSTLTLHALGISNERKLKLANDAWSKKAGPADSEETPRIVLSTKISPAEANHRLDTVARGNGRHGVLLSIFVCNAVIMAFCLTWRATARTRWIFTPSRWPACWAEW